MINRIEYNDEILIDVSQDTAKESDVEKDIIFMKKDGTTSTGSSDWKFRLVLPEVYTAGDFPVVQNFNLVRADSSSWKDYGFSVIAPKTGQYKIKWLMAEGDSGVTAVQSQAYVDNVAIGSPKSVSSNHQIICQETYSLQQGQVVNIQLKGYRYSGDYYGILQTLMLCIDFDPFS